MARTDGRDFAVPRARPPIGAHDGFAAAGAPQQKLSSGQSLATWVVAIPNLLLALGLLLLTPLFPMAAVFGVLCIAIFMTLILSSGRTWGIAMAIGVLPAGVCGLGLMALSGVCLVCK